MWIAVGGIAIVVLIIAMTMLTIWVFTNAGDLGGDDGEEEDG